MSIIVMAASLLLVFLLRGDDLERGATDLGPEIVLEEKIVVATQPDLAPVEQQAVDRVSR